MGNVQILGWCISYVFACVMVMVAVPTVSAAVSSSVDSQVNSALSQHGDQMTAAESPDGGPQQRRPKGHVRRCLCHQNRPSDPNPHHHAHWMLHPGLLQTGLR